MSQDETNLRDLAAMFAMCGLLMRGKDENITLMNISNVAYELADAFMQARESSHPTNRIDGESP